MTTCFPRLLYALLLLSHAAASILRFNNSAEIKCIEREREALLNFKHGLIDVYGILSTWRDDENSRDCCKWKAIQCDHQTGHVSILSLRGQYPQYLRGTVNFTSLFPLQNIQHLDLSNNYFFGSIPTQLGSLKHLRYLDLSYNNLEGELPYQLGNLSQLRYLDLRGNSFSGALPFQVGNLPFLHTLRLPGNFDVKPKDAEWLSSLHSLTNLALYSLHNLHLLQTIIFPNVRELRLVDCFLSDTHIHSLFYSNSNFSTSLTILDLSSNMLTFSTFQFLSNFSLNLQELYLSQNNIVLSSPVHSIFPSLVILDLSYNNMISSVFQGSFKFSSKLQNLYLRNCSLGDDSFLMSAISIINSSSPLVNLDLSFNMLKSSSIFYWLINSTTNLRTLDLSVNVLEGPIPDRFGKVMSMGIGYFTGFWGLLGPILLWRSLRNAYLRFLNRFTDCIYDRLMYWM